MRFLAPGARWCIPSAGVYVATARACVGVSVMRSATGTVGVQEERVPQYAQRCGRARWGGGDSRTGRIRGLFGEATGVDQNGAYKDGNLEGQGCREGFRNPGFEVENVRIRLMVPKDIDRMGPINDPCPFTGTYTLHPTP